MKSLALVIGNSKYSNNELKNPVNDAVDFGNILKRLGFSSRILTNLTHEEQDSAIDRFGNDLDNYDIGLFYFAGHGFQIEGENFLTVVNTNFSSEGAVKYSSTPLNKVLNLMEKAKNDTNIIILDACRNNPYERNWTRGSGFRGLAPIFAPKGTIIAFATSPGETASDGVGSNGLYTSALIAHINDKNIPIEEFFKRVRNSVFAFSSGKQTSWEHTSLTGNYFFNIGQLVEIVDTPYTEEVIIDKKYEINKYNSQIDEIIAGLKSHNWYTQNSAISSIQLLSPKDEERSKIFLLGRNILQAATGGSHSAIEFMEQLAEKADRFSIGNDNDLVNGVLFEVYFNSSGKFREKNLKYLYIDEILKLLGQEKYKNTFDFIRKQLEPYFYTLFFIPTNGAITVHFNIIFNEIVKTTGDIQEYKLQSITYENREVLVFNDITLLGFDKEPFYEPLTYNKFFEKIAILTSVPQKYLTITSNFELSETSKILFPYGVSMIKNKKNISLIANP